MGVQKLNGNEYLQDFTRRWQMAQWLELLCYVLSVGLIVGVLSWIFAGDWLLTISACLIALLMAGIFFWQKKNPLTISLLHTARLFNRQEERLEYSAELLLQEPASLSLPARLQRRKIERELATIAKISPPVQLRNSLLCLLASGLFALCLFFLSDMIDSASDPQQAKAPSGTMASGKEKDSLTLRAQIAQLTEGRLQVAPPKYTGLKPYYTELVNVEAPEGSRLTWQLQFDKDVTDVWLSRPGRDSTAFKSTRQGKYTAQLSLNSSTLYQLLWQMENGSVGTSDYFQLEALVDEAPKIQLVEPEQYVRSEDGRAFKFRATVVDDYDLTDAYLSLTISRGSGEGVKFREKKLWFEQDFSGWNSSMDLQIELDPKELEMEPGDELYYYLLVMDNRQPKVQRTRTETYFFHWLDTASESSFEVSGMAMDIMPDYFRSQRQIIIDTEKLISERAQISEEEFEKRSGNLGVDQKLLRLRYGKFLGEEFESDAGGAEMEHEHAESEDEHDEHEDQEGHEGEEESEYGNERHEHHEPHHEEPTKPGAGNILREYMHAHDTEEGATFYEESIKVRLKAALAEMWESELRLRTLRPQEALPYEYRALEIIKDIQQATRIYVERIGFEPPPLKPQEKRLTGDLTDAQSVSRSDNRTVQDSLPKLKQAIPLLQQKLKDKVYELSVAEVSLLQEAGSELAGIVQEAPQPAYLRTLSSLKETINRKRIKAEDGAAMLKVFVSLIPQEKQEFQVEGTYRSVMEKRFMEKVGGSHE